MRLGWLRDYYETNETIMGLLLGMLGILPDVLGFTGNISNTTGKTIGDIS